MKLNMLIALLCLAVAVTGFAQNIQKQVRPGGVKSLMIDGAWIPVKAELSGKAVPAEELKPLKLVLDRGRYELIVNGAVADRGNIKLLPNTNPKAMSITGAEGPNKDRTFPAIYEISGDTLTVCYNLGGESLPKEFKTEAGDHLYLVTYKRERK